MQNAKVVPHPALTASKSSNEIAAISGLPAKQVQDIFNSALAHYGPKSHKLIAPIVLHLVETGYIGPGKDQHREFLSSLNHFFEEINDAAEENL